MVENFSVYLNRRVFEMGMAKPTCIKWNAYTFVGLGGGGQHFFFGGGGGGGGKGSSACKRKGNNLTPKGIYSNREKLVPKGNQFIPL